MPSSPRPSAFPDWTQGLPTQVSQPTPSQIASGYTAGQRPSYQVWNYQQWLTSLWLHYLDSQQNAAAMTALTSASIRLLGGGTWSWNLATQTLAWGQNFYLATPGLDDTANQCPAGSIILAPGSVAYVQSNAPFSCQGDVTSGSAQVANLTYQSGITAAMQVSGANIAAGTTVVAVDNGSLTLSNAATGTASGELLTFASSGALIIASSPEASLALAPNTVIIARALVQSVVLGVGGGHTILRNGEGKALFDSGYIGVTRLKAGVTLTAGQAVYLSAGASDGNRQAAAAYLADASAANGAMRFNLIGLVYDGGDAGSSCGIITAGVSTAFTGLTPGAIYYVNPANPGGITATKPSASGVWSIPVGTALSATTLDVNPALGASAQVVQALAPWPNYEAATEQDLAIALQNANSFGGVIVLTGNFSISAQYTIGSRVVLQGRKGASIVTVLAGGGLVMSGDGSEVRDIKFMTAAPVNILTVSGTRNVVMACSFTLLGPNCCGVYVTGCSNRLKYVSLGGTGQSLSAVGIWYAAGSSNLDSDTFVAS